MNEVRPQEWIGAVYRRLEDARFLLADGRIRTGTAQIYFAVYYASRALLKKEGFYFERHASVTGNVGRVPEYGEQLDTSFPTAMQYRREQCDYELFEPDPDDADRLTEKANDLIKRAASPRVRMRGRVGIGEGKTADTNYRRLICTLPTALNRF